MDGDLAGFEKRVLGEGDCLILILAHDVFENIGGAQRLVIDINAGEPHARRVVVTVVGDRKIVLPAIFTLVLIVLFIILVSHLLHLDKPLFVSYFTHTTYRFYPQHATPFAF